MKVALCMGAAVLLAAGLPLAAQSAEAEKVWAREQAYWQYVQADDLTSYRALWNADFLGWPVMSPEPLRKEHIADWIAAFKKNGDTLQSFQLERLEIQVTSNVATTTYRLHARWVNRSGEKHESSMRIIHTWLRQADGPWQIISGMSAAPDANGH